MALLLALFALALTACSGKGEGANTIPATIQTDRADRFKVGVLFIDTRTTNAAFVAVRHYKDGAVGEPVQGFKLPLGRHDPVTLIFETFRLSPGPQQFEITVYLDSNSNNELDASDAIADNGALQQVVTVTYANDGLNATFDLQTSISTERSREFPLGTVYLPKELYTSAWIVLSEDKAGKPGETLETMALPIGQKKLLSMKLTYPRKLLSGTQSFILSLYKDGDGNNTLDTTADPLIEEQGKPLQMKIEVTLTSTRDESRGTFKSSIHTLLPAEFVVGTFELATDAKVRYYTVTRLIEDGKPGQTLGVNEWRFSGIDREMKAFLKTPLKLQKQMIHIGIYKNLSGKGWDEETWDKSAELVVTREGKTLEATVEATFESSVKDPDAPYYANTCATNQGEDYKVTHKTELKIDCRCSINRIKQPTTALCNGQSFDNNSFTAGKGPRFYSLKGHMTAGDIFPERDEIIFGIDRGGDGTGNARKRFTIVAINYKTVTRRFVSGEVADPSQGEFVRGKGPLGEEVTNLKRGPDGKIYAYSNADGGWIFRVDPDTGDREIVWKRKDEAYGQCMNGVRPKTDPEWRLGDGDPAPYQNSIEGRGLSIGPDGSFYLPTVANGVPRPGYAVIRISKDGSSCKVISTSGARERNLYYGGIGKGYDIKGPIGSMTLHKGTLYAITWGGDLLAIDPETGDRRRLAGTGITGSSSLPPAWNIFFAKDTGLLMLTGILPPNGPGFLGVDIKTGKSHSFLCLNVPDDNTYTKGCIRGPQESKRISYMPAYQLPDHTYLGGIASTGFNRLELQTGNSYIFSY